MAYLRSGAAQVIPAAAAAGDLTGTVGNILGSGTMVSTSINEAGTTSANQTTVNNAVSVNLLSCTITRKYAASDFIIWINGRTYRSATSSNFFFGYTRGIGSLGTSEIATQAVTDSATSWNNGTAIFVDTTSGTAGDVVYFGTYFNNYI